MLTRLVTILTACLVFSCGSPQEKPDRLTPDEFLSAKHSEARTRLNNFLDPDPWVVSVYDNGRIEHTGDSLIWTGILLASLPCDPEAEALTLSLQQTLWQSMGEIYRHPTLPDKISLDGAIGLYRGISSQVHRCTWAKDLWREWVLSHRNFLALNDSKLNKASEVRLENGFEILLSALLYSLGEGSRPSSTDSFAAKMTAWAAAVRFSKPSCFRLHLGYQSLRILDDTGVGISPRQRAIWCEQAAGNDVPLIDHYCGRKDIRPWIEAFSYNTWEYRHQRCGDWEKPDGKTGLETPGIDLMHAIVEAYTPTTFLKGFSHGTRY
jgi:hypothetical protein